MDFYFTESHCYNSRVVWHYLFADLSKFNLPDPYCKSDRAGACRQRGRKGTENKMADGVFGNVLHWVWLFYSDHDRKSYGFYFCVFHSGCFGYCRYLSVVYSRKHCVFKAAAQNKNYYYKTKHFTSVSGMIYRMKQNAVGLANICILSTMVLIMVSSTTSMMIGMDDILKTRYTSEFMVISHETEDERNREVMETVHALQKEKISW